MDDIQSRSLRNTLQPYYILSRAVGVRAFNYQNRMKSKVGLLLPLFLVVYYILEWFSTTLKKKTYTHENPFQLAQCIYYGALLLRLLTIVSSIVVGLLRSKTWECTTRRLDKVNKTLEALGSRAQFHRIYIRLLVELIIFITYLAIAITSFTYTVYYRMRNIKNVHKLNTIIFLLFYTYGEVVDYTVIMDFVTLIRCIRSEIQRANDLLSDVNILSLSSIASELIKHRETNNNLFKNVFPIAPLLEQSNSRLLIKRNEIFRIRRLLRTVRHIHLELYRISRNVSTLYGIQISFGIAMNIFTGTCYLFALYTLGYKLVSSLLYSNEVLMMHLFPLFICGKIVIVNFICDKTTQEAVKTKEILYTFYAENTDYEIQQEVKMFSLQMLYYNLYHSAIGLYNLNCKHLCACVGVMTTYLVIMIQMS